MLARVSERLGQPDDRVTRASDADRERIAQVLYRAAGENRLTLDEMQQRIDVVYAAKTLRELDPVLADLGVDAAALVPVARADAPALPLDQRIGGRPGSRFSIGIVSFAQRRGGWVTPRRHTSPAGYGRAEVDLREARFAEQEVAINAFALLGGVEIIVPEDVTVSVSGLGLLGRFGGEESQGPPGAPVIRIRGLAVLGAVLVTRRPADAEQQQQPQPPELER
jgi:hypothetical protein